MHVLRNWVAQLAAADPRARRFGARHHGHRLAAPLGEARVAALEHALALRLPDDHRAFVATIADGGVGPYHGLLPLDHPVQRRCAAGTFAFTAPALAGARDPQDADDPPVTPARDPVYRGVIGLGHVGCGQIALLVVRGEAAGEVWLDAREAGAGVGPIAASFTTYVEEWIERTSRNQLPRAFVPAGRCPLPSALSAYLARCEQARGVASGALAGDSLRESLAALGPGAIAIAASATTPFFTSGDPLDPCPACEVMLENLRGQGLAADAVVAGVPPLPGRTPVSATG